MWHINAGPDISFELPWVDPNNEARRFHHVEHRHWIWTLWERLCKVWRWSSKSLPQIFSRMMKRIMHTPALFLYSTLTFTFHLLQIRRYNNGPRQREEVRKIVSQPSSFPTSTTRPNNQPKPTNQPYKTTKQPTKRILLSSSHNEMFRWSFAVPLKKHSKMAFTGRSDIDFLQV